MSFKAVCAVAAFAAVVGSGASFMVKDVTDGLTDQLDPNKNKVTQEDCADFNNPDSKKSYTPAQKRKLALECAL